MLTFVSYFLFIANKINPKIIAKWSKCLGNDGNDLYSIPEFSI